MPRHFCDSEWRGLFCCSTAQSQKAFEGSSMDEIFAVHRAVFHSISFEARKSIEEAVITAYEAITNA